MGGQAARLVFSIPQIERLHDEGIAPGHIMGSTQKPVSTRSSFANRLIAGCLLSCLLIASGSGYVQNRACAIAGNDKVAVSGDAHRVSLLARSPTRVRSHGSQRRGVDGLLAPAASSCLFSKCGSITHTASLLSQLLADESKSARSPPTR